MTGGIRYGVPFVGIGVAILAAFTVSRARDARRVIPPPPGRVATTRAIRAEGRVVSYPGATVDIRSEIGGRVIALPVREQQLVRRGAVIAELAADEERAALAEAQAQIAEANADTAWCTTELERMTRLAKTGTVPQQALDRAVHDLAAARARRAVAEATIRRLGAVLAKTRIIAPIDGVIVSRPIEVGEVIAPGTQLVTITNLSRRRVEVEVDEYDAGLVRLGAPVTITAEGYGTQSWHGTVEAIPDLVVPRRLAPQDPGRPSDMQVLLVKVTLPPDAPLKLGQRVELAIDAR